MKRRSRVLVLLVALLPLAGCAAIPTQTYPKPLGPSASRQPSVEAAEPEKNLDALQIVREFILASASPEGDYAAAKALFDMHGIHFEPAQRDEVVRRVDALKLPAYTGFVQPKLTAVTGPDGSIADVAISYPMDLTTQMLEYSGARK